MNVPVMLNNYVLSSSIKAKVSAVDRQKLNTYLRIHFIIAVTEWKILTVEGKSVLI